MAGVVTPGASRLRLSHSSAMARADAVPVARRQRRPHRGRRVPDALEAVEDVRVAVDMALGDLPVVGAGVARLARVAQHDSLLQLTEVDVERHAANAVGFELDGGDPSVQRRPVVLQPRRDGDRLRLDVHRDLQQRFRLVVRAFPFGERGTDGHVQRRRPGDAGAGGRLRRGRQRQSPGLEEVHQQREQAKLASMAKLPPVFGFDDGAGVERLDGDPRVGSRLDLRARAKADRGVERLRAGMKEIERPDVDGASGQIDARRCGRPDDHARIIGRSGSARLQPDRLGAVRTRSSIMLSCQATFAAASVSF